MKLQILFFLNILLLIGCKKEKNEIPENIVTVRLPAEPDRLNPILSTSGYASQVESHIFMPLLQFDPKSLEVVPCLAILRPEVTAITEGEYRGGFAYTFEIHEEAMWDDEKPVTAADYVFTMKTILHP